MSALIFVQIASYRDPELTETIKSCLEQADAPDNLRFGICWQHDPDTDSDLAPYLDDPRFRIDAVSHQLSRGCCWARNRVNKLYQGENYTLQIDAHMRFAPGWDTSLLQMLASIDAPKPIISIYPPGYSVIDGNVVMSEHSPIQKMSLKKLRADLTTELEGVDVDETDAPGKSPFIAAGYIFTQGLFCEEVEYDPELYFLGEEINLAIRAYTHGYDFFYPNQHLIWHFYDHGQPLHWSDHVDHSALNKVALERLDALIQQKGSLPKRYELGNQRTLTDFELYSGINFAEAIASRDAPNDSIPFHYTIRLNTSGIPRRSDYQRWVFCLLDSFDNELYRRDIRDRDILNHRQRDIEVSTSLPVMPTQYKLWPQHVSWESEMIFPLHFIPHVSTTESGDTTVAESSIFVALAAYCEPELALTIQHCIDQAQHPDRLTFGVCLQYDEDGEQEIRSNCLDSFAEDSRFRIISYPHQHSKGGCWARNIAQSMYRGERFTLQVDAHSRFVTNWDTALIAMAKTFPSRKPLITGFPPLYSRENGIDELTDFNYLDRVPTTLVEQWPEDGWIDHPTRFLPENKSAPRRTRVLSGAFVFTLGQWNVEVNQDPDHLYSGEEFALTLRSYTHGYDLFNPSQIVVWHRSHPEANRKYINDFKQEQVGQRHQRAVERLQLLLQGDTGEQLGRYGLGTQRTLDQYRLFSGLDCAKRTIHPDALNGVPPDPLTISAAADTTDHDQHPLVELTIYLTGSDPVTLICPENAPLILDLRIAIQENTSAKPSDRLMYLSFDDNGHEMYFRQSSLGHFETRFL